MATNIANSKLLDLILEHAQEIKAEHGNTILTVNHIFAAFLKRIDEFSDDVNFSEYDDEAERQALRDVIKETGVSAIIPGSIDKLLAKKPTFTDDLLLRQVMTRSLQLSQKNGKTTLTADILLKCIVDSPSAEIKEFLDNQQNKDSYPEVSLAELFRKALEQEAETPAEQKIGEVETAPDDYSRPKKKIACITDKVKDIQTKLSNVIFGQDNAISIFSSGYFQAELKAITDKTNKRPRATFLFAGPPGVGKTFLAEQAAKLLGVPFLRFDMSEYSERDSLMELVGTNKSFKGDKEGGLTGFVKKNPNCVLLFDEIEKAHIAIIHLFLQVLDAGRLRDTNSGEEVDFSRTIIIFTTNAGRKVYEESISPNLSGISRKTILKALEKDVDPKTGRGVFPAAICSRFATGNVIMFNHMEAHFLRKIVEKEIVENIQSLENTTGIKCTVSDDIYSCILFAEGGHADARMVKSRANSFFTTELYELFRLVSAEDSLSDIEDIEKINFVLDLPEDKQALKLFRNETKGCILSFGDANLCGALDSVIEKKGYVNKKVQSLEEAKRIVESEDIEMVFCDMYYGKHSSDSNELNIEDVESEGREFFQYVCGSTDVPLYVLSDATHDYSKEEMFSLLKEGARDIIDVSDGAVVETAISDILLRLHQQQSMIDLAKASKLITYETAQTISADGKTAEIRVFDLALETSIDAEDAGNILSDVSKPNVKFSDIIGAEGAKSELKYFVDYLRNPKTYSSKGLGVPKGVLFYGPPGTGKTMLAKAVAGESDVTFISAEGNQFLKKWVGEGPETVHRLFATARKYAPTIIFIDEIDAIAKERTGGEHDGSADVLTALLAEMDGFKTDAKRPIFVMAATNFEVEPGSPKSLDSALLRRFDRHIYVELPDKKARIEYIKTRIKDRPIFNISDEEIENLAVRSTGMSLAILDSVFEFSMRIAIRANKDEVDDEIIEEAFESYNFGEEKKWEVSELKQTAYHEAGHAFLYWYSGETPSYLTIVARGNHGGYMQYGDNEKRGAYTKNMLIDIIRTSLAGRASELVFFGEEKGLTTGASADLRKATDIAKRILCDFGMDEEFGLAVIQEQELAIGGMANEVRAVVNSMLETELNNVREILERNRPAIEAIVEELLKKDHLGATEINSIFSAHAKRRAD